MAAPTCLLRRVARDRGVPRAPDESAERSPSPEGAPEARREAVALTVLGIRSWRVQCTVPLFVASGCLSGAGLCGSGHEPPGESLPGAPEERAVSCAPGRLLGARAARAGAGISLWGIFCLGAYSGLRLVSAPCYHPHEGGRGRPSCGHLWRGRLATAPQESRR